MEWGSGAPRRANGQNGGAASNSDREDEPMILRVLEAYFHRNREHPAQSRLLASYGNQETRHKLVV